MTLAPATEAPATSAGASGVGAHARSRRRLFLPFALPAIAIYVALLLVPTVATVVLSFSTWSGSSEPVFQWAVQYLRLFASDAFWNGFRNTMAYVVVGGVGTFLVAFLFTMVLRDMRASRMIRAVLFFPNIVAPVALGMFFGYVYKFQPKRHGTLNYVLESVGLDPVKFLRPENITWVVMVSLVWASVGFYVTILMAAVDRIPPYLYEDAEIAGASPWQKFRNVTLPMTWDVVGVAGVLWTIGAVKIFELVYVLAGAGTYSPPIQTWTLGMFVYDRSFGSTGTPDFGGACACGVLMMALVIVLVLALRRAMRREVIQF